MEFNFEAPIWILVTKKAYAADFKKVAVPKKDERPIHGLVSDKNFIVANAVEAILSAPALPQKQERDYLKKKNFGKVPKYVGKIKAEIEDEYNMVREMQIEEQAEKDRQKFLMPEGERQELIAALKKKWEVLHIEYQQQTHYVKYDTLGKKNRNEALMREMDQIEADIKKLNKNYIFIDTTQPSSMWWRLKDCPLNCPRVKRDEFNWMRPDATHGLKGMNSW